MAGQDASKLRKGSKTGSVFGQLFKGSKKPANNGFVNPQGRKGKISDREMREFLKAQEREFLKAQERLKKAQGRKGKISDREMRRLNEDAARWKVTPASPFPRKGK